MWFKCCQQESGTSAAAATSITTTIPKNTIASEHAYTYHFTVHFFSTTLSLPSLIYEVIRRSFQR